MINVNKLESYAMKLFECQNCGQPLFFENTRCESCGFQLGYLPAQEDVTALEKEKESDSWHTLAEPHGHYRYCANAQHDVCNWLVPADSPEPLCLACRHNRTIPDLSQPQNLINWRKTEIAKRRLFYTLLKLRLPITTKSEEPGGLAFDFVVARPGGSVMTGHQNGLITITLSEADDSKREKLRQDMGEAYRTLLGHFRHEIAHYYWERLVKDSRHIENFRKVFGDERNDYALALKQYYANGPAQGWQDRFATAYASSHPWEDFAETWAHYFHMIDTLETARAFGLRIRPRVSLGPSLATVIDLDPYKATMDQIIDCWLPLTFAVNSINRSMGLSDLYPFVLAPAATAKLSFIHDLIRGESSRTSKERQIDAGAAVLAEP